MKDDSTILSVGIDVGTSTTQVVFSKLQMDNSGGFFTVPKVSIVDKQVVYKSEVYTTPLKTDVLIDTDALEKIVAAEFQKAGYSPADTGSGAVIITGESARKENSDAVLKSLSGYAGDFVVSAAGPDMESVIAGKGSGAFQYSIDHHAKVANLDIGGGTTNVVVFDDGAVAARGCLDIGGRLIRVGRGGIVKKVSPAAAAAARAAGVTIHVGDQVDVDGLRKIVGAMAGALERYLGVDRKTSARRQTAGGRFSDESRYPVRFESVQNSSGDALDALLAEIKTPGSSDFELPRGIEAIFFSGGVADLVYHPQEDIRKFGDIGVLLGQAIAGSRLMTAFSNVEGSETIRATVVGAGTYTTSISGSTITYSQDIFPLKNIPVIKLDDTLMAECFAGRKENILQHIRWYMQQNDTSRFILAMNGKRDPGYREMKQAAAVIGAVCDETLAEGSPILLVIDCDIAKAMGQMIRQLPGIKRDVAAIDSIHVEDGEYVDMGKPVMNGMVIPVVVKTLIFG